MKLEHNNLPAIHQDYLIAYFDFDGDLAGSMADCPWLEHKLANPQEFTPSRGATVKTRCHKCHHTILWEYVALPGSFLELDPRSNRLGYLVSVCGRCEAVNYVAIDRQTARTIAP